MSRSWYHCGQEIHALFRTRQETTQDKVRMDGSRRISLRNRKYLRKVDSFCDTYSPPNNSPTPGSMTPPPTVTHSQTDPTPIESAQPSTTHNQHKISDHVPHSQPDHTDISQPDHTNISQPDPSAADNLGEEVVTCPGQEIPSQHPSSHPDQRLEMKKLAGFNNPGLKENWETQSRLRPRKK